MAHEQGTRDRLLLRKMTSLYLLRPGAMLMLCRVGSRVVRDHAWCGIGGHFEPEEYQDPRACLLRELSEETGWGAADLSDLSLRYITLRQVPGELRENYFFFARLKAPERPLPFCYEGRLEWIPLAQVLSREMPFSARQVLAHYLERGHLDHVLYGGLTSGGREIFAPLTVE